MQLFEHLKARGFISQTTHEEEIRELLNNGKITFYTGFDPTADSLHAGSFLQLMAMAHLQKAGHRPIAILGGGTTMVGDPTGRTDMRKMLTKEQIAENAKRFQVQMSKIIDFSEGKALMLNNADWLLNLNYMDFLREVGIHFSVNRMLTFDCFKSRMEKGLSFMEFNYMLMQSYDFLRLFEDYNCVLELGGEDQWSNIIGGIELIRRSTGKEAYGMTFSLLTTSDGRKMGKTASGALWLDPEKTPPYEFYQYWRNVQDADVIRCLKLLTFLPLEEISRYETMEGSELNEAKSRLAYEITALVHGKDEAEKAQDATKALFGAGGAMDNAPKTILTAADFENGQILVIDLLVKGGLAPSKGEARRLIQQGGIEAGGEKVSDLGFTLGVDAFTDGLLVKKGKKTYHMFEVE